MGTKKKYLGRSSLFFGLLFCLLLGFSFTTCYAVEPDYSDFDLPIEFFDNWLTYIQSCGFNPSFTAQNMYDNYDINIKTQIKNTITNLGGDERNLMVCHQYYGGTHSLYFFYSNNSVNNVPNKYYLTASNNSYFSINSNNNNYDVNVMRWTSGRFSNSLTNSPSNSGYIYYDSYADLDNSTISNSPFYGVNQKPINICNGTFSINNTATNYFLNGFYNVNPVPEPEQPSGDTGGSGDSGGGTVIPSGDDSSSNIDYTNQLNNINNNITNVQNQISGESQRIIDNQNNNTQQVVNALSGETNKITNILTDDASDAIENKNITSGDFADIVDFSPITDNQEYTAISNLWYELLNGFSNSLTNVNRSLFIEFRNEQYEINLDNFSVFIPSSLKLFFGTLSTVAVVIYISKNIKHLTEDIQTASIDNVANKLTEDFETNLF